MKNNNGKGLYDIGEQIHYPCGCYAIAEKVGYTHFLNPDCPFDDKWHPSLRGYKYILK
ncbi:hypothetical protein ES703_39891 [subsurface metagenome]